MEEFNNLGRVWLRGVLSKSEIADLANLTDVGTKPGLRLSLTGELSRFVGPKSKVVAAMKAFGVDSVPVRLVSFNKGDAANWSVPWHQDRVVAVAHKADVDGYSNWVRKSGFWHCEAPLSLLQTMIFVRIHFDDSAENNGPMEVALGSHKCGIVSSEDARTVAAGCRIESGRAEAGDVLVAHALMLHRSVAAAVPAARRALRIDYARGFACFWVAVGC